MDKDLQNILRFTQSVSGLSYIANLDGTPKAICSLGIPFDELDLLPTSIGATDSFYIGFEIPEGLTVATSVIKFADNSTATFEPQYDPIGKTITGFTRNDAQSILIKTA